MDDVFTVLVRIDGDLEAVSELLGRVLERVGGEVLEVHQGALVATEEE